jgi:hypothetical protein
MEIGTFAIEDRDSPFRAWGRVVGWSPRGRPQFEVWGWVLGTEGVRWPPAQRLTFATDWPLRPMTPAEVIQLVWEEATTGGS